MGYQEIGITNGWQFFTVTFENVTDSTTFYLSDILCKRPDGGDWARTGMGAAAKQACAGAVQLQKISKDGNYGQVYKYYGRNTADTFGPGWYEGDRQTSGANLITKANDVELAPGEGLIVQCTKDQANFLLSGNVKLQAASLSLRNGWSFGGNCTPVEIKLSQIGCTRAGGEAWTRTGMGAAAKQACAGAVQLQKITSDGNYAQVYKYYGKNTADTFGPGWYAGDRKTDGSNLITSENDITFKPGEGWILQCTKDDDAAKIVIPSPL